MAKKREKKAKGKPASTNPAGKKPARKKSTREKPAEDADQGAGSGGTPAFAYICLVEGGDEESTQALERFEREAREFERKARELCEASGRDLRGIEHDVLSQEEVTALKTLSNQIFQHGFEAAAVLGGPNLRKAYLDPLPKTSKKLKKASRKLEGEIRKLEGEIAELKKPPAKPEDERAQVEKKMERARLEEKRARFEGEISRRKDLIVFFKRNAESPLPGLAKIIDGFSRGKAFDIIVPDIDHFLPCSATTDLVASVLEPEWKVFGIKPCQEGQDEPDTHNAAKISTATRSPEPDLLSLACDSLHRAQQSLTRWIAREDLRLKSVTPFRDPHPCPQQNDFPQEHIQQAQLALKTLSASRSGAFKEYVDDLDARLRSLDKPLMELRYDLDGSAWPSIKDAVLPFRDFLAMLPALLQEGGAAVQDHPLESAAGEKKDVPPKRVPRGFWKQHAQELRTLYKEQRSGDEKTTFEFMAREIQTRYPDLPITPEGQGGLPSTLHIASS